MDNSEFRQWVAEVDDMMNLVFDAERALANEGTECLAWDNLTAARHRYVKYRIELDFGEDANA